MVERLSKTQGNNGTRILLAGLRGLDLQTGSFTLRQINMATNNFDVANKIGEGGFGSVYKGNLPDGTVIAVKQLSSKSSQGSEEHQSKMDWPTRHKIYVGIARGLAYLHEESRLKIVHRDIKATNVLLDKELNPKTSDFGLAKLHEEENTHISTHIAGTLGYMAPEYAMSGYLTDKADVYSFGVVLLEIVSGKSNTSIKPKEDCFYLLDWAHLLKEEGRLMEVVDLRMEPDFDKDQVMLTIEIALLCTNVSPTVRPSMSAVISMLEGRVIDQKLILDSSALSFMENPKEITDKQRLLADSNESQNLSMSIELPLTASSTSASDLYPVNLMTDYLESRL